MKTNRVHWAAVSTASGLVATSCLGGAPALYSRPDRVTAPDSGWEFIPSKNPGGAVYHEAEGLYPDRGGQWRGPSIPLPVNAFAFYRLSFDAKAPKGGYWAVFFEDRNGQSIVSDVYSSLEADAESRPYSGVVYGREGGAALRIAFQSTGRVDASSVKLEEISAQDAAAWCDALYATLPPLDFQPPGARLNRLPRTVEALRTGKPWRIVWLGDSIINDTFNSNLQALIARRWPRSNISFICSVRGSTGCWYYQDPAMFKQYVTDLRPDLLVVGGISHKEDADALRVVLDRARKELGCELLLMSGPMNHEWRKGDLDHPEATVPVQTWTPDPFVETQRQLAEELGIEFWDMAGAWHAYLGASRKPLSWFHRDAVHANDRGKQVLGRIVEAWLAPR